MYESDDENAPIKIIDFGISAFVNPENGLEERVGTVKI